MKIIDNINGVDLKRWELLLQSSSYKSFFQTKNCYDLYNANQPFMTPFFLGVEDNDVLVGVIIGFIQADGGPLKRFFSRRAIINGGPLLADNISAKALTLLLNHCKKVLRQKAIYVEFRNFEDYSCYKDLFKRCGFEYVPHLNFHIDTTSEEVVNSNLGKSRKRDIRTSFRDGAEIVEHPTMEDVCEFYGILNDLYTNKVKTPLYPMSFFEYLFKQSYSKFLLVRLNGEIIGGTVCVTLPGYAVYEWYACGKDGAYKNIYPSTVATFAAIQYAAINDYHHFDMMGAGKPDESYGVREFKAKFGGQLVEHGRFLAILNPLLYEIGKLGVKLMKKL
jgi:lipid II:glycine glycyltransferase (peptidoglycan interpeptide bridge formation enzyme)